MQRILKLQHDEYELKLHLLAGQSGKLHLASNEDLSTSLVLDFNTDQNAKLTIDRTFLRVF